MWHFALVVCCVTRIWVSSLLRSFLLLSLIEWKINIVYHHHWHWPHYHRNGRTAPHIIPINWNEPAQLRTNRVRLIDCTVFDAFFFATLYVCLVLFQYVGICLYNDFSRLEMCQFFNSSIQIQMAFAYRLSLLHSTHLSVGTNGINFFPFGLFSSVFLFYSRFGFCWIHLLVGFDGNIFRFCRKLCTTRLNYRLQIAKNKTHTSNQFFTVSSFSCATNATKNKVCAQSLLHKSLIAMIYFVGTLVCVWLIIYYYRFLSINRENGCCSTMQRPGYLQSETR